MATIEDQLNAAQKRAVQAAATEKPPGQSRGQAPGNDGAKQAAAQALMVPGEKSVEDAVKLSVQARVESAASTWPAVWWFSQPEADWGISSWWSPQRDLDLREFVKKEGNDILAGAIATMIKKFKAMNWVVDGPKATVQWAQDLLGNAEFGKGWSSLISKTIEDFLTCDNGAFWEIIGKGDPGKPLDGLPVGVAHLDSVNCTLTGDPAYPVVFRSGKSGKAHKLHASRVVHMVDMESPSESMNGVGFCAVSRVVASSQLLLMLSQYKREKLDDLPQAGLLILNNVVPQKWEDAKAEFERERRKLGQELWANVMTLIGVDPAQAADAKFISFSNLPDHFNEQQTIDTYVNIVALGLGVDRRELFPAAGGGSLGTATESLVMHQKAKGKGIGELISTLERAVNWHLFPSRVSFEFDFQDDEEDQQRAAIEQTKASTIISLYVPDPTTGKTIVTRDEVRQMLADHVEYFDPEWLLVETDEEEQREDIDRDEGEGE